MLDVAVVIPTYNRAATVGRAIESVLAQTVPVKEVIVVDDGSKDDSFEVAERYRSRDARVRAIRQANAGAGAARNTGIAASTCGWIGLLDSDDAWAEDKLLHACAIVDANPSIDLIHSNVAFIEPDGVERSWDHRTVAEMTDPMVLMGTFFMRTSTVLVKRSLLDRVGYAFPPDRTTGEDFDLFWRLMAASSGIGYAASRDASIYITADGLTRINTKAKLIRDNIGVMGKIAAWLQAGSFDGRYSTRLRNRQYEELRRLLAIGIRDGALPVLVRDLRYGAAEISGGAALRAFASAGLSLFRRST